MEISKHRFVSTHNVLLLFTVIEHDLPDREQLAAIGSGVATETGEWPEDAQAVLDASMGLTRFEAENAYSLSLVRHGCVKPETVNPRLEDSLRFPPRDFPAPVRPQGLPRKDPPKCVGLI